MTPGDDQGRPGQSGGRPDYRVYRSRPGLLSRLRSTDLDSLRNRLRPGGTPRRRTPSAGRWRWLRWIVIPLGVWLLLSFVAFGISAQIQRFKLADGSTEKLGGNPFLLASPQTILLLGSDRRDEATAEPTFDPNAPSRADTIMLLRIGAGTFHKLSIPRDSFAAIPGHEPQKINAAYALDDTDDDAEQGNTTLMVQTVENFLGIDIDHVVLVDFEGFKNFIDAIGGVEVDIPDKLCSEISGGEANGGFTKHFGPGEETLDGEDALIFARTRINTCPEKGDSDAFDNYDDLDRAAAQQEVLSGIKGRLTSPLRLPYNFIKGPIIGWTAPKAIISDMGALTMPQLVLAAAVGGDSGPELLEPSGSGPLGSLIIPQEECQQAVEEFLGSDPPRSPACSP
ncbi:MAG TPA: LCP family protein [Solirubrobacterales bacterium]|nr:LCP family protein [Solirubrobacterales bacterium]